MLLMPACISLQKQIDAQQQDITLLQQRTLETNRAQANYQNEIDKIKREIQSIRGSIDENAYRTEKNMAALKQELDRMLAMLKEYQGRVESFGNQPPSVVTDEENSDPDSTVPSDEKGIYDRAYRHFQNSSFEEARMLFNKFLKTYPQSDLADNALYWIGSSYYKEKKYAEAISAFEDVIKNYPAGNKVPDTYYFQALSFCEINDPLTAQILLETLIQGFPTSQAASLGGEKLKELNAKAP